jgi:hypothetical protein
VFAEKLIVVFAVLGLGNAENQTNEHVGLSKLQNSSHPSPSVVLLSSQFSGPLVDPSPQKPQSV